MPQEMSVIDSKKLPETTINADMLLHSSESQIVTDTTSLNNSNTLGEDKQPNTQFLNNLEPESLDSLIVQSDMKYGSATEHKPDIVSTDVADVNLDGKVAHEVVKHDLDEDAKKCEKEKSKKISINSFNVTSELNITQVSFVLNLGVFLKKRIKRSS